MTGCRKVTQSDAVFPPFEVRFFFCHFRNRSPHRPPTSAFMFSQSYSGTSRIFFPSYFFRQTGLSVRLRLLFGRSVGLVLLFVLTKLGAVGRVEPVKRDADSDPGEDAGMF